MTALWTTSELPGRAFDPEPDEDDQPWCLLPLDLGGQGADVERLLNMTTIKTVGSYL